MRGLVESGEWQFRAIAERFHTSHHEISRLVRELGWHSPHDKMKEKGPTQLRKTVSANIRRANKLRREEALATLEQRMAECRCRRLTGKEFAYWARKYEARDRAERERAAA